MKKKFVGIIDYGFGNIASVKNALNYLKIKNSIISKPNKQNNFSHLILPGDGFFPKAAEIIKKNKVNSSLKYFISLETFMDEFSTIFFRQLEKK